MEIDKLGRMMSGAGVLLAVLGLGVTIVVVAGVFFLLFRLFRGLGRANAERDRLLREGVRASARILNVEMGGMTMFTAGPGAICMAATPSSSVTTLTPLSLWSQARDTNRVAPMSGTPAAVVARR